MDDSFEFLHLPSERLVSPAELGDRLCHYKPPFWQYLGQDGGPPDNGYSRLDAEVEKELIAASAVPISYLEMVPRHSGVYLVYYLANLVYVGCTYNLRSRCAEHLKSVSAAKLIDEDMISIRYAVWEDRSAIKCIEDRLIVYYEPEWNGMGFGRRPRGDNRQQQPSRWDYKFDRILPVGGTPNDI